MGKKNQGRVITYDQVPDNINDFILDTQVALKKKLRHTVSKATTITYLLKQLLPVEKQKQA